MKEMKDTINYNFNPVRESTSEQTTETLEYYLIQKTGSINAYNIKDLCKKLAYEGDLYEVFDELVLTRY